MRILCIGTYDTGKPRTRILLEAFKEGGHTVDQIHFSVWEGIEDKSQIKGISARIRILVRWLLCYPILIWKTARVPKPDIVCFPYLGLVDAFVLGPILKVRGIPYIIDAFISLYDTVVQDRALLARSSLRAKLLFSFEGQVLRRVNRVLIDTQAHADYFIDTFDLKTGHVKPVFVGAETSSFPTLPPPERKNMDPLTVLFYGQCIPLHGMETILEAASLSQDLPVKWVLIGKGQEEDKIQSFLKSFPDAPVSWIPWVQYPALIKYLGEADLCLGIFGTTGKASRVIPNKVFQILQAGRPLLTRDSPAMRELVAPGSKGIQLIPAGDPSALYEAIKAEIGKTQVQPDTKVRERFSLIALAAMVNPVLDETLLK